MTLPLDLLLFSRVLDEKTITPTSLSPNPLDDLTLPGFYVVNFKKLNPTYYNTHVIVSANDDNSRVLQLLANDTLDDQNAGLQYRQRIDGTWSEWKRLMTEAQVTTKIDNVLKQHGLIQ